MTTRKGLRWDDVAAEKTKDNDGKKWGEEWKEENTGGRRAFISRLQADQWIIWLLDLRYSVTSPYSIGYPLVVS